MSNQNRIIRVNCCNACPLSGDCKEWKKLTKKQKVYLALSNDVPVDFMLSGCPLEEDKETGK